jgi:hypothetical protein
MISSVAAKIIREEVLLTTTHPLTPGASRGLTSSQLGGSVRPFSAAAFGQASKTPSALGHTRIARVAESRGVRGRRSPALLPLLLLFRFCPRFCSFVFALAFALSVTRRHFSA